MDSFRGYNESYTITKYVGKMTGSDKEEVVSKLKQCFNIDIWFPLIELASHWEMETVNITGCPRATTITIYNKDGVGLFTVSI